MRNEKQKYLIKSLDYLLYCILKEYEILQKILIHMHLETFNFPGFSKGLRDAW